MSLYRRPDSRFWYMALERPGQRPIRQNTRVLVAGPTNEDERKQRKLAEQIYTAAMGDLARARYQLPQSRPVRTFGQYRTWYAQHVSSHKGGYEKERSMLRMIGRYLDARPLHELTADVLREWRTARIQDVSVSTQDREWALLRHVLATAVPKYLEVLPFAGIGRLRKATPDTRVLSREEEARLLAVASPEERAIILCALDTLQRLSAVASLRRSQDHGDYLYWPIVKSGKAHKVYVSSRLRASLDALPAAGPHLFPAYATTTRPGLTVQRMFQDVCKRAGVVHGRDRGGVTFHSLRHSGATRMLDAGESVRTVMEIGGWSTIAQLQRYLHPTEDGQRRAVESIGPAPSTPPDTTADK